MTCHRVDMPGIGTAIVCTGRQRRRKCSGCGRPAELECDWKVPGKKSGTCDKAICHRCTTSPAPGKDICPKHKPELVAWQAGDVR